MSDSQPKRKHYWSTGGSDHLLNFAFGDPKRFPLSRRSLLLSFSASLSRSLGNSSTFASINSQKRSTIFFLECCGAIHYCFTLTGLRLVSEKRGKKTIVLKSILVQNSRQRCSRGEMQRERLSLPGSQAVRGIVSVLPGVLSRRGGEQDVS